MRKCWTISHIKSLRPWDYRGLRTSRRIASQKLAVSQLSNAKLLGIIHQETEDATSIATAQTKSDGPDSQKDLFLTQTRSLPPTYVPLLPQSPLTDPNLVAARNCHRAVKPLPSGERSPFQLKLQKNPYGRNALICVEQSIKLTRNPAIALATPPRLCVLTGLRLPSYFQISFGVATHPKTGAPWHLPNLSAQFMSSPRDDEMSKGNTDGTVPSPLEPDASMTLKSPTRTLSSTHFLASRHVFAYISGLTPSRYERLMPYRWRQDPSVKLSEIVWREDMDIFVLGILRRNVLKTLSYLASRPAAYIAPCKGYDSINKHTQVAAVLWLRQDAGVSIHDKSSKSDATLSDFEETGPPPYAMHFHKTRYVPYYNLAALLGPSQLSALHESRPDQYGDQFVIIKLKRNTVKVQLELWKLLGYIAQGVKNG